MDDEQLQKLIGAGIAYISIHLRSEAEILKYLNKKAKRIKASSTIVSQALRRLSELKYVDDEAYARMFVESRIQSRPKGERLLRLELKTKGVQSHIIDTVCREFFTSLDKENTNESIMAHRVIERKWRIWQKLPVLDQKRKLYQHLASRGFSSSVIYRIIDELTRIHYNR